MPQLEQVLDKIKESQRKQMKVLKANLVQKDRNQVTLAMREFKEKKAEETAKELLEDKILTIKEKNENKASKVALRKAALEAEDKRKRKQLAEKEKREMMPI